MTLTAAQRAARERDCLMCQRRFFSMRKEAQLCSFDCAKAWAGRAAHKRWHHDRARGGKRARFEAKIVPEPNSGCWLWDASVFRTGYARFDGGLAHRWAYEHYIGPIPAEREIDHKCRVICCVNPAHLEAVTHQENVRRRDQVVSC